MARKKSTDTAAAEEPIVNNEEAVAAAETQVEETPAAPAEEAPAPAAVEVKSSNTDRLKELTAIAESLSAEGKELADENPKLFKEYKELVTACIAEGK